MSVQRNRQWLKAMANCELYRESSSPWTTLTTWQQKLTKSCRYIIAHWVKTSALPHHDSAGSFSLNLFRAADLGLLPTNKCVQDMYLQHSHSRHVCCSPLAPNVMPKQSTAKHLMFFKPEICCVMAGRRCDPAGRPGSPVCTGIRAVDVCCDPTNEQDYSWPT